MPSTAHVCGRRTTSRLAAAALMMIAAACGGPAPLAAVGCDRLVFSSLRTGEWQIHVMSSDSETQLTSIGANVNPTWSPDGSRILFTSTREGDHDLYTMAADGDDVRLLTVDDGAFDSSGDWSPDASRIAFDRVVDGDGRPVDGEAGFTQIFVGDPADGLAGTQLTFGEPNAKPRWSPDGGSIAFLSWRDGNSEIYTMAPDGGEQRNVSRHPAFDTLPAWSPDGARIAFVSDRSGNWEIHLMNADGSDPMQLTTDPAEDRNPRWSTDGSHVLFTSTRDPRGIYVVAVDGDDAPMYVTDGSVHDCAPPASNDAARAAHGGVSRRPTPR